MSVPATEFDALMEHIDDCDFCTWTGRRCAKARSLLDAAAVRTAEHLAPPPYLPPGGRGKA